MILVHNRLAQNSLLIDRYVIVNNIQQLKGATMNSQDDDLNSLLKRISYERSKGAAGDDVLVVYNSAATHNINLCNIGKINYILEIGDKLGDNAVRNLIREKTEELDRQIISGSRNALLYPQRTD